jgi:phage gp36-like protein
MYCEHEDLLLGDLPISADDSEKFINAAGDEIDAIIGMRYVIPVGLAAGSASYNLLKRVCVLLATGRLVMANSVASEDTTPNAYGMYLLSEAKAILDDIKSGDMNLIGATLLPPTGDTSVADTGNAPTVIYQDSASAFDVFYDNVTNGTAKLWRPNI